jgi:hypothetical protein
VRFQLIGLQARGATYDEEMWRFGRALIRHADASALQHVRVHGDHALDRIQARWRRAATCP